MNNHMPRNFKKLDEMNIFLETYHTPKLSQEEAETLNSLITAREIEAMIKTTTKNKTSWHIKALGQMASQENFTKHLGKS